MSSSSTIQMNATLEDGSEMNILENSNVSDWSCSTIVDTKCLAEKIQNLETQMLTIAKYIPNSLANFDAQTVAAKNTSSLTSSSSSIMLQMGIEIGNKFGQFVSKFEKIDEKLDILANSITGIDSNNAELCKSMAKINNENDERKREIAANCAVINGMKKELAILAKENKLMAKKVEVCKKGLAELGAENGVLKTENDILKCKIVGIEKEMVEMKNQHENKFRTMKESIAQKTLTNEKIGQQFEEMRRAIDEIKSNLHVSVAAVDESSNQIDGNNSSEMQTLHETIMNITIAGSIDDGNEAEENVEEEDISEENPINVDENDVEFVMKEEDEEQKTEESIIMMDTILEEVSTNGEDILRQAITGKKKQFCNKQKNGIEAKKIKCLYCDYQCQYQSTMQNHERIHTGEKPFKFANAPDSKHFNG